MPQLRHQPPSRARSKSGQPKKYPPHPSSSSSSSSQPASTKPSKGEHVSMNTSDTENGTTPFNNLQEDMSSLSFEDQGWSDQYTRLENRNTPDQSPSPRPSESSTKSKVPLGFKLLKDSESLIDPEDDARRQEKLVYDVPGKEKKKKKMMMVRGDGRDGMDGCESGHESSSGGEEEEEDDQEMYMMSGALPDEEKRVEMLE